MKKIKRSYYLPAKLIDRFDGECQRSGFVRERVVAAAVFHFLRSDANNRHAMFIDLDKFLKKRGK
jgi:hypothetical protein